MSFNPREKDRLVKAAAMYWERIEPFRSSGKGVSRETIPAEPEPGSELATRLARWRKLVADDDHVRFAQRLKLDGLTTSLIAQALENGESADSFSGGLPGRQSLEGEQPGHAEQEQSGHAQSERERPEREHPEYAQPEREWPEWVEILDAALDLPVGSHHPALDASDPIPFEEILLPFVEAASRRLASSANLERFSPAARAELERGLLRRLSIVAEGALFTKFFAFRTAAELDDALSSHAPVTGDTVAEGREDERPSAQEDGRTSGQPSRRLYQRFVDEMARGGLRTFILEYPVLGRLLGVVARNWIRTSALLAKRLYDDDRSLADAFGCGTTVGRVESLATGLSDAHDGGQSVIALTLSSGLRLIYKPRPVGMEASYYAIVDWCNRESGLLPLRTLTIVDRETYGWVEYIDPAPLPQLEAAGRYYERAGMILALAYVLGISDLHLKNLFAAGEHPVLIDIEVFCRPSLEPVEVEREPANAFSLAVTQVQDSVLSTGLLPGYLSGAQGGHLDIGGLTGEIDVENLGSERAYRDVNTDAMRVDRTPRAPRLAPNQPTWDGRPVGSVDYIDRIIAGFEGMYRFLESRKHALVGPNGLLAPIEGAFGRFIPRPTKVYSKLLRWVTRPQHLRSGLDFSIELDVLSKALVADAPPPIWPIFKEELKSLAQMDIPLVRYRPNSSEAYINSGEAVCTLFSAPGFDRTRRIIQGLCEDDLERQKSFIRASLYARYGSRTSDNARTQGMRDELPQGKDAAPMLDSLAPPSPERLIEAALEVAHNIERQAVRGAESLAWLQVGINPTAMQFHPRPMSFDLYGGYTGIALFFAALYRATRDERWRSQAFQAMFPLRDTARVEYVRHQLAFHGIGGAVGLGSLLYALTLIARLLGDDEPLQWAREAARLMTSERIRDDRRFDVMLGSAGAIIGLLTLHRAAPDDALLDRAVDCGRHLLEHRTRTSAGLRAWLGAEINAHRPLAGFGHGAAGIASALIGLHAATGDDTFLDAALEGMGYEDTLQTDDSNWQDLRLRRTGHSGSAGGASAARMNGWCHGAAGIGLGRLHALRAFASHLGDQERGEQETLASLERDVERALVAARQPRWLHGPDHLCCGVTARIDLLISAGRQLHRSELCDAARLQAGWMLARATKSGGYRLPLAAPGAIQPCDFFQGTSGIGYMLLRLTDPDTFPSPLMAASI